mmetsp:Transcript_46021/g.104843  ORF Transcript_46021/g.104843 Transcript_46021/m.104843 type:complete len:219 (+) Transcript_46021:446-1102(+)
MGRPHGRPPTGGGPVHPAGRAGACSSERRRPRPPPSPPRAAPRAAAPPAPPRRHVAVGRSVPSVVEDSGSGGGAAGYEHGGAGADVGVGARAGLPETLPPAPPIQRLRVPPPGGHPPRGPLRGVCARFYAGGTPIGRRALRTAAPRAPPPPRPLQCGLHAAGGRAPALRGCRGAPCARPPLVPRPPPRHRDQGGALHERGALPASAEEGDRQDPGGCC